MGAGRVAIMQPYVFPYVGYFHLIDAADHFVFYDDVAYIKGGWINRNRILENGAPALFTIPLRGASPNRLIREVAPDISSQWKSKFIRRLRQDYARAPYASQVIARIDDLLARDFASIADLAIASIAMVFDYLGKEFSYSRSSGISPDTRGLPRADRLIAITKGLGLSGYVNAPGGRSLYRKEYFSEHGVALGFINSRPVVYGQFGTDFVENLSIIDCLMFSDREQVLEYFALYSLD